ncbi:MAG TPA: D-alanyl-D-alanine carboxypeptidase/D-alanyl-D-alanine-endopeptidase [Burkholderiales bacterium]|jgi:D-alanyl-D-alanine carboxypeptidase/D-alanyl-D-alanine-endopeptidase (penicillin-binding protein 4)
MVTATGIADAQRAMRLLHGVLMAVAAVLLAAALPRAHAQTDFLPVSVARALAQADIPEHAAAFYVHEIGAERPLLAAGATRPMNPASSIKLVTSYAALELLGPAFQWVTEAYAAGTLRGGVLEGDLVLKGRGDPKLTLENFWLLLRSLRSRGLREIRGDLVLDRTYFAASDHDPARFDEKPTRPYNTGPDALLVNFKAVRLSFVPDDEAGVVRILAEPALPQVQIVNRLKLVDGPCGDWVNRLKVDAQGGSAATRLAFRGRYAASCGEQTRSYSVLPHAHYVLGLFRVLWHELGGKFAGTVRDGTVSADARPIASVESPALAQVVRDMNKFSNNVMARQLYLTLGAETAGEPATAEKAGRVIRDWLAGKGLSFPEMILENGSGLSRVERISARHLGQLLLSSFQSPVMPEFIASLPLAAMDGTMKKRLADADVAGQAHIKTGSLTGVRSIAGYMLDARGRRWVVVSIVNHPNAGNAQAAQDALLTWIYHRGESACCPGG